MTCISASALDMSGLHMSRLYLNEAALWLAHPNTGLSSVPWEIDPYGVAAVLPTGLIYGVGLSRVWAKTGVGQGIAVWRALAFGIGWTVLTFALLSPLDSLSDLLFSAHMLQHELLMLVVAPLMILGRPMLAALWILPRATRLKVTQASNRTWAQVCWGFLSTPWFALALHGLVRWIWHAPALFEGAMRNPSWHAFQHFTFFASAALFFRVLFEGRYGKAGYGVAMLFVFATALHTSVLGALFALGPHVAYAIYALRSPLVGQNALEDQELAGLLMWIPSGFVFAGIGLALFGAWLGEIEKRAELVNKRRQAGAVTVSATEASMESDSRFHSPGAEETARPDRGTHLA
ncbi:MAG TPA: cytochrome c oxidase assembly protein [Polyangiaceae bacterium]|nr:cytochrome c oxidase assembly protein [Polyangiaceae bacterium]